jgi:hypothetical protein
MENSLLTKIPETVDTQTCAKMLGRRPQTLRAWSSRGDGPLQPIRINGRRGPLRWRLDDIVRILSGGAD